MLSYRTIVPHTLELLKQLCQEPYLKECRLVGGTAYRALMSLTYFADADPKEMPTMFEDVSWDEIKAYIKQQVASYERSAH